MSTELKFLIELVKAHKDEPVCCVVDQYMKSISWSLLKDEFKKMNQKQRNALYRRLKSER